MHKLGYRIFLIMLPLALLMLVFGYAYYRAKVNLQLEHVTQSSQLAIALGTKEMSYAIEQRLTEFDRLSRGMSQCSTRPQKLSELMTELLNSTSGFSALLYTNANGRVLLSTLSANDSNRYILRKDLKRVKILDETLLRHLGEAYYEWKANRYQNTVKIAEINKEITDREQRGEINSFAVRDLKRLLIMHQERNALPNAVASLAEKNIVDRLGLIYNQETYFLSRPYTDCAGNLRGYYVAVIDRTLFEDQLFRIKSNLKQGGIEQVDIGLIRNFDRKVLTTTSYIKESSLKLFGLNKTPTPQHRKELGGILINDDLELYLDKHLIKQQSGPVDLAAQLQTSMFAFIPDQHLNARYLGVLNQIAIYTLASLVIYIALTYFLAKYIATPIEELSNRVKALGRGRYPKITQLDRNDEIGELWQAFSNMASSIRSKEQILIDLARRDPLTGALNRRAFMERSNRIKNRKVSSVVCMMDLDMFKAVNDLFGHASGDNVLQHFCELVEKHIREGDIFGRLGGEEFAIIFPDTDLQVAIEIAEKIRASCERHLADAIKDVTDTSLTVSIGLSEWQSSDFHAVMKAADRALYRSKESGRNRVSVEDPTD